MESIPKEEKQNISILRLRARFIHRVFLNPESAKTLSLPNSV